MAVDVSSRLLILDPTSEAEAEHSQMAPRTSALAGATIGLLDNSKHHAKELLDLVEALLRERIKPARVLSFRKPDSTRVAPEELIEDISKQCNAVINGVGD